MWEKLFKRDQFFAGIILGVLLPALFYLALFLLDLIVVSFWNTHMLTQQSYLFLLSIAINLFTLRYYFVTLNYEKTGRGVLLVTFIATITFFLVL